MYYIADIIRRSVTAVTNYYKELHIIKLINMEQCDGTSESINHEDDAIFCILKYDLQHHNSINSPSGESQPCKYNPNKTCR